jgi:hypothetical protein
VLCISGIQNNSAVCSPFNLTTQRCLSLHAPHHGVEQPHPVASCSLSLSRGIRHVNVEPLPTLRNEGVDVVADELSGTGGLSIGATGDTILHVSHHGSKFRSEEFWTVGELQREERRER